MKKGLILIIFTALMIIVAGASCDSCHGRDSGSYNNTKETKTIYSKGNTNSDVLIDIDDGD